MREKGKKTVSWALWDRARTAHKEREECGGVKGALGQKTAHHLTYS
jgi:hypothetical protein